MTLLFSNIYTRVWNLWGHYMPAREVVAMSFLRLCRLRLDSRFSQRYIMRKTLFIYLFIFFLKKMYH